MLNLPQYVPNYGTVPPLETTMNPARMRRGLLKAKRVLSIWRNCNYPSLFVDESDYLPSGRLSHSLRHTRVSCSCHGCGNPRRHYGEKTVQERRSDSQMRDQLEWDT